MIKMNKSNTSKNGGIGFTGLLQLVFITLKLLKVIDWSWVWVLAPVWITAGLVILVITVYLIALFFKAEK
jgi:uncharacterized membrane protein YdbT with pleckstrin-like domain